MRGDALIVEDESVLAKNMALFFRRSGYSTRVAETAEDALRQIEAGCPDVVLLDYHLPGMSGLELLARLKNMEPELKVVMITGQGSVELALVALRLGAADFLTKPISLTKLLGAVDRVLGHGVVAPAIDIVPGARPH